MKKIDFELLDPIIFRWIKKSKSSISITFDRISIFFLKVFYILISEIAGTNINYINILSENFLNRYEIDKKKIPAFKERKSDSKNINLLDLIPEKGRYEKKSDEKMPFFLEVINKIFAKNCTELKINLKSDLRKPLNLSFAKLYEIQLFIENVKQEISSLIKSDENLSDFLRYGGYSGQFYETLQHILRNTMKFSKSIKRIYIPKNRTGTFFTPKFITEYINLTVLRYWFQNKHKTVSDGSLKFPIIADISAGLGFFIDKFVDPHFLEKIKNIDQNLYNFTQSYEMGDYIYGYESNELFIDILRINHQILKETHQNSIRISNLITKDTLLQGTGIKFDILVGNPPWGTKLEKKTIARNSELKKFTDKQYDSYSLFTARNIITLKKNGFLFLILPETILLSPNYTSIRKYILKHTTILEILHLGERIFHNVNMPSVIIGLQNSPAPEDHYVKIITDIPDELKESLLKDEEDLFKIINSESLMITDTNRTVNPNFPEIRFEKRLQRDFQKNDNFSFDIFANSNERKKLEQMENANIVRLKDLLLNSRGVEIGKKGNVIQCYHCGVWMAPLQWKLDNRTGKRFNNCRVCKNKLFFEKMKKKDSIICDEFSSKKIKYSNILLGENVNKYYIRGQKIIKLGYRGIKYKTKEIYQEKKIVLRKTSDSIAATVDYQGRHTIQVVYQFSLKEDYKKYPFFLEYILGIITSKIMYFFYSKKYVYQNRKNFPHHIQSNILNLPIPSLNFEKKDSKNYRLHIKISFLSMLLMFLNQTSKTHVIDRQLIKQFLEFIKINHSVLVSEGFFPLIDEKINRSFRKLLENPIHLNISQATIDFFKKMLDQFVEDMFGVN